MAEPSARTARKRSQATSAAPCDVALFDTFGLVFRAFHALPAMFTSSGEPTSALYGFCAVVLKLLRERRPACFAFALDAPQRTFRRELYPQYKAQRPALHPELGEQLERLPRLLQAFGAPVFRAPGFEADDLLATLVERLPADSSILIASGDRDLLQLVSPRVHVLFLGARGKDASLFDEAAVIARFGVAPSAMPAYAALVGDPSDNLLGVPGIGPATAAKLVREHGDIPALLAALPTLRDGKLKQSLLAHVERLRQNELLATLRRDAPLTLAAPDGDAPSRLAAPLTRESAERLRAELAALEFKSLMPRLEALVPSSEA